MRHPNYGKAKPWLAAFLVDPPATDDCIPWPFSLDNNGYAQVNWEGSIRKTARVVLQHLTGPAPAGRRIEAAHAPGICHNRACVNPRHLRWATPTENSADKLTDGTHHRGQRHGMANLTDAQALTIYHADGDHTSIAGRYGISRQAVTNIKNGHTWAWLTGHRRAA